MIASLVAAGAAWRILSISRLALLTEPLVQSCYGVRKIQRRVLHALVFNKLQLIDEAEARGIKIETLVYSGGLLNKMPLMNP